MYASRHTPLAFAFGPRTGSRAAAEALAGLGFVLVGSHHSGPGRRRDLELATIVRNPWDAMASWWYRMHRRPEEGGLITVLWLSRFHHGHAHYFGPGRIWPHAEFVPDERIVRYESLQEELERLLSRYGFPSPALFRIGGTRRQSRSYRELYTPEARAWVGDTFRLDVERFGYDP